MIFSPLKTRNPASIFFLMLGLLVGIFPFFLGDMPAIYSSGSIINNLLFIDILSPITISSIVFGIIVLTSLFMAFFSNKFVLPLQGQYLSPFLFILFSSAYIWVFGINEAIIATVILMVSTFSVFQTYREERKVNHIFDTAFISGIACLVYFPAFIYAFVLLIGIIILRKVAFKDIVLWIIGIVLPHALYLGYLFMYDRSTEYFQLVDNATKLTIHTIKLTEWIVWGILLLMYLLAEPRIFSSMVLKKISSRKYLQIFTIASFLIFVTFFVNHQLLFLALIPVSYITGLFFNHMRSQFLYEVLLLLVSTAVIFAEILPHLI